MAQPTRQSTPPKDWADQAPTAHSNGFERGMDAIHRGLVAVDKAINRVIPEEFNPFYYLGGITNVLWVLLVPTGVFLWFYYQGTEAKAYESVTYLTQGVPFGGALRGIHRYAGDGMLLAAILHLLRNYFTDRYRGFRDVPWVSGVILLFFTATIGLSGYLLVWDQRAVWITNGLVKILESVNLVLPGVGTWLALGLIGGEQVNNVTLARMLFLHTGFAVVMFFFLWIHYLRLHRPKIWPPAFVTLMTIGAVVVVTGLNLPLETLPPSTVPIGTNTFPYDIFYLWPIAWLSSLTPATVLTIIALFTAFLMILPWLPRKKHRYVNAAFVTPENCTGCQLCAIDCPFDAIVMVPGANPDAKRNELAVVNDDKCAECGICVGACPFHAINLPLAHEDQIKDKVVALLS